MKKSLLLSLAVLTTLLGAPLTQAADVAYTLAGEHVFAGGDPAYGKQDDMHQGGKGRFDGAFFDAEMNFMRFYQTDGVGPLGTPNRFNHEATPRVTIGYVSEGGLGARVRYWNFSYTAGAPATQTAVDTYNIDAELFERLEVGHHTSAEWSAGLRYNDFRQDEAVFNQNDEFGGIGLLIGFRVDRDVFRGNVYARGRWSILTDTEANDLNFVARDKIGMQTEIGVGYESALCLRNGSRLTGRLGYEHQFWSGFGVDSVGGTGNGITGVGFGGIVVGLGIER